MYVLANEEQVRTLKSCLHFATMAKSSNLDAIYDSKMQGYRQYKASCQVSCQVSCQASFAYNQVIPNSIADC